MSEYTTYEDADWQAEERSASCDETEITRLRAREAQLVEALTELYEVRHYVRGTRKRKAYDDARKALATPDVGE